MFSDLTFSFEENAIPLSIIMRQKRDQQGLADLQPNAGMNPTYQAYFEALLVPKSDEQNPTDKAAVVKYIRRRERRKRAEENQKNNQLTEEVLEKVHRAASLILPESLFSANSRIDGKNGRNGY